MKKHLITLLVLIVSTFFANAQSVIPQGNSSTLVDNKGALKVSKGLIIPIVGADSMFFSFQPNLGIDSATGILRYHNGDNWVYVSSGGGGDDTWEEVMNRGNKSGKPVILKQTAEDDMMNIIITKDSLLQGELGIVNSIMYIPDELGMSNFRMTGMVHKDIPYSYIIQNTEGSNGDTVIEASIRVSELADQIIGITMSNIISEGGKGGVSILNKDNFLRINDEDINTGSIINYSENYPLDSPYTLVYKQYVDSLFTSGGSSDNWNDVMNRGFATNQPIIQYPISIDSLPTYPIVPFSETQLNVNLGGNNINLNSFDKNENVKISQVKQITGANEVSVINSSTSGINNANIMLSSNDIEPEIQLFIGGGAGVDKSFSLRNDAIYSSSIIDYELDVLQPLRPASLIYKQYVDSLISDLSANLSLGSITSTSIPILNSSGTGVTLPQATSSLAGLLNAQDKNKILKAFPGITPSFTATPGVSISVISGSDDVRGVITVTNPSGSPINNVKITVTPTKPSIIHLIPVFATHTQVSRFYLSNINTTGGTATELEYTIDKLDPSEIMRITYLANY